MKREDVGRWEVLVGALTRGPSGPQGETATNQASQAVSSMARNFHQVPF